VLQLYSFDSGYSLVVLGEGEVSERIRYYNFFPEHSFLTFYYHEMNLPYSFIISKILVYIFNFFLDKPLKFNRKRLSHKLCYISDNFDNIFRLTFFLERDISMIFCGHRNIIITHFLTLAWAAIRYKNTRSTAMER